MIRLADIETLAKLSRISVSSGEKESLRKDLDSILVYVAEIQEVLEKDGANMKSPHRNVLRLDEAPHELGMYTEALLSCVPEREGQYVKVKKIL